ncbi:MAG: HEAT repeat domain-containing protein [Anaerolineae bacterium]|nr:HEAT repeat domain-containing protein [Anaerolineae bacterium]
MSTDPRYIEKWVGYLQGSEHEMSIVAAKKLGATKDPAVIPHLLKALVNRPDDLRTAVIRALAEIGDRSATSSLVNLLHDSNPLIASASADALGWIKDAKAVPSLVQILVDYKTGSSRHFQLHGFNRGLFMAVVHALKSINTREAQIALEKYNR